jgi:hypothetical protein
MNEEEKRLLEGYKRLSRRSQLLALAQITYGAEMEENARRIAQIRAIPDPLYVDREPIPMGAKEFL